jgi:DNA-directed RNA polymerase specialized sigma24 family protein
VWRHIDGFDGRRASCATWLRKILRNLIRDKVRHTRSVLAGARIVETPRQELATDDSGDAPARSINDLPLSLSPHNLYIMRALIDGADLREIAEATELSLKAIRGRFDRIRKSNATENS